MQSILRWGLYYLLFRSISSFFISQLAKNETINNSLLLVAHPDDESMFFSPFLYFNKPFILCLSDGDFNGKGKVRREELGNLCKSRGLKHEIMNYSDNSDWDENQICLDLVLKIKKHKIRNILTFDFGGVSGHKNHISCYKAASKLEKLDKMKFLKFKYLKTVGIIEKYLYFLKKPSYSIPIYSNFGVKNMLFHKSQLVWFRYFYIAFSSYMKHITIT